MQGVNTPLSSFVPLVSEDCPGGLNLLKEKAVLASAMEFCRRTRMFRTRFDEVATVTDATPWIDINAAANDAIEDEDVAVRVVDVGDVWLSPRETRLTNPAAATLDRKRPSWESDTADTPTSYLFTTDRRVRIYPALSAGADPVKLDMELVLTPARSSAKVPDFLYDIYADTIVAGAVQRLKTMPDQPWSNPGQAVFFFNKNQAGIDDARIEAARRIIKPINNRARSRYGR